jgi:hypothetical protein
MSTPEYRIEFTIQRAEKFGGEYVDVGFGSSGGCESPAAAAYEVNSMVQNGLWETEAGMPDPGTIEKPGPN